jgi:hypothetical protein
LRISSSSSSTSPLRVELDVAALLALLGRQAPREGRVTFLEARAP